MNNLDEQLIAIRERQNLNLPAVDRLNPEYAQAVRDIDLLLSLVDGQQETTDQVEQKQ